MSNPVTSRRGPAPLVQPTATTAPAVVAPAPAVKAPKGSSPVSGFVAGQKAARSEPTIAPHQTGIPHKVGSSEDYGHGFHELTMVKHGHERTVRYPKANSIPEVKLDVEKPLEGQLRSISDQMVALIGPATELINKNLKANRITSPFDVEVKVDGKSVNLAKAEPGSLTPDFVNKVLYEVVKQRTFKNVRADIAAFYGVSAPVGTTVNVTGAKALAKLEAVVSRAVELSEQGFGPPLPKEPARRAEYLEALKAFAMKNLFHGENLTTKHQVQGFDVLERNPDLNETLSHDIVDRTSIQAVLQIDPKALDPKWARAWVLEEIQNQAPAAYAKLAGTLTPNEAADKVDAQTVAELCKKHPEWNVNPNAGEARYLLPMYHWGDERNDADSMMHWHRAANHHDGDLEKSTQNIQQKRQNGVEHHAGTEHVGVRHEAGLGYDGELPFERTIKKIWADSAFKHTFWRTGAMKDIVFQRVLQESGMITPEDLQKSVNPDRYLKLDEAYQSLQMANVGADKGLRTLATKVPAPLKAQLDAATAATAGGLFDTVAKAAAKAKPEEAAAMWQYLQATMLQRSSASVDTVKAFMPVADKARAAFSALGVPGAVTLSSMDAQTALAHRTALNELRDAAQEARTGGDSGLAAIYEMWNDIARSGFASQAH